MKKKTVVLLSLLLVLVTVCYAQVIAPPHIQWQRTYAGNSDDELYSLVQTSDGGYILGGSSNSSVSGDKTVPLCVDSFDFWIIKIDCEGSIQWQRDIGGSVSDIVNSIIQTSDGGYFVGGYTLSNASCQKTSNIFSINDWWAMKLDDTGGLTWQVDLGGTCNDYLNSVQQTADGGYILGGDSRSNASGGNKSIDMCGSNACQVLSDYWVVKLSSSGAIQWQGDYGGTAGGGVGDDNLNAIRQTKDHGYILGGNSNSGISCNKTSAGYGGYDYWIVKIDSVGNMQWQQDYGGSGTEALNDIKQTFDGGYILGGTTTSNISGDKTSNTFNNTSDFWVVKVDSIGGLQWQKDIGGTGFDALNAIQQTTDSGYILGGFSNSDSTGNKTVNTLTPGQYDYWIVKLSKDNFVNPALGDTVQWQLDIGRNDTQAVLFAVEQTTDGGYILGGVANPFSASLSGKVNNVGNAYGAGHGGPGTHYWVVKLGNCDGGYCGSPPPLIDSICFGNSVTLDGVTEYGGFNWVAVPGGSPISSLSCTNCADPVATPAMTTQYVELSAANPNLYCSDTATVVVTPLGNIRIDTNICFADSVQLNVPVDTGVHNITWTPALYLNNSTIQNPLCTPTVDTDISYIVTVTNNNVNHCTSIDTVNVTHYQKISFINPDTSICYGASIQIPLIGNAAYSYNWSPATYLDNAALQNPTSTPPSNITYLVTANYLGCKMSLSYLIDLLPLNNIRIDTNICFADSVQLDIPVSATSFAQNIVWTPALYLNNNTIVDPLCTPTADTTISYNVAITVTNNGINCTSIDTVNVTHLVKLSTLNPDTVICFGTAMQIPLIGEPEYNYSWTPAKWLDNAAIENPTATPDSSIVYTVVATHIGCSDTLSYPVNVDHVGNITFTTSDTAICEGKNIIFYGNYTTEANTGLIWNFGDGTVVHNINPAEHAYTSLGQMTITFTATYKVCPDTSYTATVNVNPYPVVNIGTDTAICPGQVPLILTNLAAQSQVTDYLNVWSTGDTSAIISVTAPGTYWLTVTTGAGCSITDTMIVHPDCYLDIPNAFTPNGDGINDYFFPRQFLLDGVVTFSMEIYNRWGQLIFSTTNINGRGWDGRFNSIAQPDGVYVYIIDATFKDGKAEHHQGNVTLIR